jgi:hypothetical protein
MTYNPTPLNQSSQTPASNVRDDGPLWLLIADTVPNSTEWMYSPNSALGGLMPSQLLGGSDEEKLRELVLAYKYGIFA